MRSAFKLTSLSRWAIAESDGVEQFPCTCQTGAEADAAADQIAGAGIQADIGKQCVALVQAANEVHAVLVDLVVEHVGGEPEFPDFPTDQAGAGA